MKRVGKLIGLALVAAVMMCTATGCMSLLSKMAQSMIKDYGVYDKSVPEDQLCDFIFTGVDIKTFNGKPVFWGGGPNNLGRIKVPAGTHGFVFDWIEQRTSRNYDTVTTTTRTISDLEISQIEFLPGDRYHLSGSWYTGYVRITMQDITNSRAEMYGDKIDKVPKISNTPTVFEGDWKGSDTTTFKFAGNTWENSIPPGIQGNLTNDTGQSKGTFEIDGDKITMYLTHAGRNGTYINVSGLKTTGIWAYSFEGENLNLERSKTSIWTYSFEGNQVKLLKFEKLPPNIVYTKQ